MRRGAVTALFFLSLTTLAQAVDLAYERALDVALASPILPAETVEEARDACDTALCFAQALSEHVPDEVRLEPVAHPDTDSIRWVETPPSVTVAEANGTRTLRITHFGRKAVPELRTALAAGSLPVVIDLRGNPGGDFERMLEIAGLLLGSRRNAVEIDYGDRLERRSLEGPCSRPWRVTHVRIDEMTGSAALFLARLLADAGAERIGSDHGEPVFLKHRLTITHDWRLILPVAELGVPHVEQRDRRR